LPAQSTIPLGASGNRVSDTKFHPSGQRGTACALGTGETPVLRYYSLLVAGAHSGHCP